MLRLYPSTMGSSLIKISDLIEMTLRLPARRSRGNQYWTRKRLWSASQMIDSKHHCGLITVSFASFFSFTHSLHERLHWILKHTIAQEHKTDLDIIVLIQTWFKRQDARPKHKERQRGTPRARVVEMPKETNIGRARDCGARPKLSTPANV